jgi:succinate dehydrogenase/fumarate reductase flavoprotein subunit
MPEFDVLVIGGGASGLRAAIAAKRAAANVALITKAHPLRRRLPKAVSTLPWEG